MIREKDILRQLPELLAELLGLSPQVKYSPNKNSALIIQLGEHVLAVEVKSNSQAVAVADAAERAAARSRRLGAGAVGVVVVPYMGEVGQTICRKTGVGFIDLSGNARIVSPPLVVRVEGRPNKFISRGRPSSVFAPMGSRVARLLLLDPERWWRQHEIAEKGEMDAGYVSRICKRLESDRFIERGPDRAVRPRDASLLFDAWRRQYDFESHDVIRGHVAARSGEELVRHVSKVLGAEPCRHAFTGLPAAWLMAPFARFRLVSVYLDQFPDDALLNRLRMDRHESGANLWLLHPNDLGVLHGGDTVQGIACVSPVQAYLDLHALPERSEEAAEQLRKERLQWR